MSSSKSDIASKLPFKLKRKAKEDIYSRDVCCVQKCDLFTSVVDASHNFSPYDLPLCDKHWEKRAELPGKKAKKK